MRRVTPGADDLLGHRVTLGMRRTVRSEPVGAVVARCLCERCAKAGTLEVPAFAFLRVSGAVGAATTPLTDQTS